MSRLLPVGRVSKLFGLEGELTVNLYDTFPDDINLEEPLYVVIDGLAVPLFIETLQRRGRNGALVRFSDIDNPERAAELPGMELMLPVQTKRVAKQGYGDELLPEELIGFGAEISEEGRKESVRGVIEGVVDSEFNPLFSIDSGGREILIPVADEFIESVDVEGRTIEFRLPEGFLDLYL